MKQESKRETGYYWCLNAFGEWEIYKYDDLHLWSKYDSLQVFHDRHFQQIDERRIVRQEEPLVSLNEVDKYCFWCGQTPSRCKCALIPPNG